jgi:NAD(P)-dependent dehydrogenase (short-subunit alcohol dehydrogenase family)
VKISLADKNILVTGGARGLGEACARKLSEAGGRAAIADIDYDAALAAASRINNARAYRCDFGNPSDIAKLHQQIRDDTQSGIDILINNAGIIAYTKELKGFGLEEWNRLIDVNLRGAFWTCREFAEDMQAKRYGKIINLSSLAARMGGIDVGVHYTVSKAGIIGLTKDLAKKLGPFGVNVNAVAPGIMLTEPVKQQIAGREEDYISKIPLGRLGRPEDVANVILFLSSHLSDYMTGCVLDINGGMYMG